MPFGLSDQQTQNTRIINFCDMFLKKVTLDGHDGSYKLDISLFTEELYRENNTFSKNNLKNLSQLKKQ